MNLHDAVVTGRFCGLQTVEECVLNIERHSMSIFAYTEMEKELKELSAEYSKYIQGLLTLDEKKIKDEVQNMHEQLIKYCEEQEGELAE